MAINWRQPTRTCASHTDLMHTHKHTHRHMHECMHSSALYYCEKLQCQTQGSYKTLKKASIFTIRSRVQIHWPLHYMYSYTHTHIGFREPVLGMLVLLCHRVLHLNLDLKLFCCCSTVSSVHILHSPQHMYCYGDRSLHTDHRCAGGQWLWVHCTPVNVTTLRWM